MHANDGWYKPWRAHMESLLRQEGVEYYGMVNQSEVARAYDHFCRRRYFLDLIGFPRVR